MYLNLLGKYIWIKRLKYTLSTNLCMDFIPNKNISLIN